MTVKTVKIRYDGPSDLLDVGDQVIARGSAGDIDEKLAKQLDESDWADITIADASGKFAKLATAPEPVPGGTPVESAAELAADIPILGQPVEDPNDKKKVV